MMHLKKSFSKKELTDSGLALLLLTLLAGLWVADWWIVKVAIGEVLVLMIAPALFYPFSFIWLNLSEILGKILSKVILSLIFLVIVCPVALVRRAARKDSLSLKQFRSGKQSVFKGRDRSVGIDFTKPY